MEHRETLLRLDNVLREAGFTAEQTTTLNFLDKTHLGVDVVKEWSKTRREECAWLKDWLETLKDLEGDFARHVSRDPLIIYRPANETLLAFHKSTAKVRYLMTANRCGKTQGGLTEHGLLVTGRMAFRPAPFPLPVATFVIGPDFSNYAPNVFEKKMITGESQNPLSPMFPEGGKWLYKYNSRTRTIYISCRECAEADKARNCPHSKSTITLFSDQNGPGVIAGGQYNYIQFDEHIDEEFFDEAYQRLQTVRFSRMALTGTPQWGEAAWEIQRVKKQAEKPRSENTMLDSDGEEILFAEVFHCGQIAGGLVPPEETVAARRTMSPAEARARLDGYPAPLARHCVFDTYLLYEMEKTATSPIARGELHVEDKPYFVQSDAGKLSIWKYPEGGKLYVVGADVAMGIVSRDGNDYSCAVVLEYPSLEIVAQYHHQINPLDYARVLNNLGLYYNVACIAVERTGGVGTATILRLKELEYLNIFQDYTNPAAFEDDGSPVYGISTTAATKGLMISFLQNAIKTEEIRLPCRELIKECYAFGQQFSTSGKTTKFGAESGGHDDRVMALVFAVYVVKNFPMIDLFPQEYNVDPEEEAQKRLDRLIENQLHRMRGRR